MQSLVQIENVVTATRAAQALVEEAHREIEMSGIRPVLRLASLDAKIPLSLLRLPSDPSNSSPVLDSNADFRAMTIDAYGLLHLDRGSRGMQKQRKVSWPSQQLAQVMSDVADMKPAVMASHSTEAVAGSPDKDRDCNLSVDMQLPEADSSRDSSRRSSCRMISPFALKPASSQF